MPDQKTGATKYDKKENNCSKTEKSKEFPFENQKNRTKKSQNVRVPTLRYVLDFPTIIDAVSSYALRAKQQKQESSFRTSLTKSGQPLALRDQVAVIAVQGNILSSKNGLLSLSGRNALALIASQ